MVENDVADEIAALTTEVERLRTLVGPSEDDYRKLQLDVLGARDAAMVAEVAVGLERSRSQLLETELARAQRDFLWVRRQVIARAKSLRSRTTGILARLTGR